MEYILPMAIAQFSQFSTDLVIINSTELHFNSPQHLAFISETLCQFHFKKKKVNYVVEQPGYGVFS